MEGDGFFCPDEGCGHNRGGTCARNHDNILGVAPAAVFLPGQTNFMMPFGPAVGLLRNDMLAEGQPPMEDAWGMWRDCPRRRQKDY